MSNVKGAFTVRFLRNGDQVYVSRNIVRIVSGAETGASLTQTIDPISGDVSPKWTVAENQPIIKLRVVSARGYITAINSVSWAYDGNIIAFGASADASGWHTSTDGRFQRKMTDGIEYFKIIKDLASVSSEVVSNKQITYTVSYTSNAMADSITQSVDVQIQQAGSDSHSVVITTARVELDASAASTVLRAECLYGINSVTVGQNGYTMKWYQDNEEMAGQSAQTLTVTRDMVSGGSVFTAKLYRDGTLVAQDGQRINDTADVWKATGRPSSNGNDFVSETENGTYTLYATKNGVEQSLADSAFSWEAYNSLGAKTGGGSGKTVVITKAHALCTRADGVEYYGDVDIVITLNI